MDKAFDIIGILSDVNFGGIIDLRTATKDRSRRRTQLLTRTYE